MVAIKNVRISNATFKAISQPGMVGVFAGATSGIGMGTLKAFIKNANSPTAYIIGRSQNAATPLLDELKRLGPTATLNFIESEISLIKNVDAICDEIKQKVKKVDFVFLSAGYLTLDGRVDSSEGIDIPQSLRYYSRLRFIYNLLPLLQNSPTPRVVSILGAGMEKPIDLNDLEMKNDFTWLKASSNGTTQTTLALEELAKTNPRVSFLHVFPGPVDTGALVRLTERAKGIWVVPATIFKWIFIPVMKLFGVSVDEAGERGLFLVTSKRYPPADGSTDGGVELPKGVEVARSTVVDSEGKGNGVYRLGGDDESAPDGKVLPGYRKENAGARVWESTLSVWEKALERSA